MILGILIPNESPEIFRTKLIRKDLAKKYIETDAITYKEMNTTTPFAIPKSPSLIPVILHTKEKDHKMLISESTLGVAIIAHIQTKIPRKNNESQFIWIKYKGNTYPLHRDVNAKYLFENYKSEDGKVHLIAQPQESFGTSF